MLLGSPLFLGGLMLDVGSALVAVVARLITSRPASHATSPTDSTCDILGERYTRRMPPLPRTGVGATLTHALPRC